jgi:hypothetical protein
LYQFACNVFFLVLVGRLAAQKVRKEKEAENEEHDEEFHQYNQPQGAAQSHASKTFDIEVPDMEQCILHNTG